MSRIGSTFAMTADRFEKKNGEEKGQWKCGGKNNVGCQQTQTDKTDDVEGEQPLKKKIKCFNCGEDHYINNCSEFLQFKKP
jgi:hypothetical protein